MIFKILFTTTKHKSIVESIKSIWVVLQKLSHFKYMKFKKLTTNFFDFFDWNQKYKCLRHHFQYLAQFIASWGGSGAIQIFSFHDYGTSFTVVSIWLSLSSYRHPIYRRNSSSLHKNDCRSSFGKYQVLLCLPRINFLYDSILCSIIGINPSIN